jgi:hypothetical protein
MRLVARSIAVVLLISGLVSPSLAQPIDPAALPYADKASAGIKATLKSYEAAKAPKALAMNPNGRVLWWSGQASEAEASRRVLESCEFAHKSPCVLAIVGNRVQTFDRAAKPVSAFARIGKRFDETKVPFLSDKGRAELAASIATAKRQPRQNVLVVVLHPNGHWWTYADNRSSVSGRGNAPMAIAGGMNACRSFKAPDRSWKNSDCILYAQDNAVVAKLP